MAKFSVRDGRFQRRKFCDIKMHDRPLREDERGGGHGSAVEVWPRLRSSFPTQERDTVRA